MGNDSSSNRGPVRRDELDINDTSILFNVDHGVDYGDRIRPRPHGCSLSRYTIFNKQFTQTDLFKRVQDGLKGIVPFTIQEERAIGCMVGNAIGDALGAPLEFSDVQYDKVDLKGFHEKFIWTGEVQKDKEDSPSSEPNKKNLKHFIRMFNRFNLEPGQWTDDFAMALCLGDSLLYNKSLVPRDARLRFLNWWRFGYCNAFGYDTFHMGSVGLGANISASFAEFEETSGRAELTKAGNRATSGNGSVMRLSPVSVFFSHDTQQAMHEASRSSLLTHQGDEAAECCRLLAYVCSTAIHLNSNNNNNDGSNNDSNDNNNNKSSAEKLAIGVSNKNKVLSSLSENFKSPLYAVTCLAGSVSESAHPENDHLLKMNSNALQDRNWNWRQEKYYYAPSRARSQPGYVGSYSMDALAMALHCVWSTNSFTEAVLKAVNIRGDADSVGAVTAQIAGSFYGVSAIPLDWIEAVQQWDCGGRIAFTAYCLFNKIYDHVERLPSVTPTAPPPAANGQGENGHEAEEDQDEDEDSEIDSETEPPVSSDHKAS